VSFTVTATIDKGRAAEQLRKRSARRIQERGQRAADDAVRQTQRLINAELGPSDGRSEARGLISMRSMPFRGEVTSGGDFPIRLALHNDVTGPSAAKFGALEFGARGGEYEDRRAFPGQEPQDKGRNVYPRGTTTRKATAGHFFMRRGLAIAVAGVYAGFQFTRSYASAFASRR
jgi:hypothetical protein